VGAAADFILGHKQGTPKNQKQDINEEGRNQRLGWFATHGWPGSGQPSRPTTGSRRLWVYCICTLGLAPVGLFFGYDGFALVWVGFFVFFFVFHMALVTFMVIKWF
jgi:hypothetical protein